MSKPLTVLQVEDSESDAALIVRLLENAGYDVRSERVETAPRMRAALEKQAWDAIIADYHLPQFDAPSALAVLRDTGLDIPFIVVSGAVGEDRAVAMMKAGAHDYLMKSSLLRLVPAVEREIQEAAVRRGRKAADEALRIARQETERSHQLLDAVFTAQMDALVVYNTAGIAIRANPAAPAIFGFDPTGMGNAAMMEKLQLPAAPGRSATQRALAGETVVSLEQPAADRTFETSSSPMRDAAGQIIGAVTIMRDISGKKRAEQRLQQAQKLESIALLAGGIAHDFNNILTVVSGNISLALEESCPDCEARSILPAALESVAAGRLPHASTARLCRQRRFRSQARFRLRRRRTGRRGPPSVTAGENPAAHRFRSRSPAVADGSRPDGAGVFESDPERGGGDPRRAVRESSPSAPVSRAIPYAHRGLR